MPTIFRNVLVNVDESAQSHVALAQAIDIARGSYGRIGLLAAIPPISAWISTPPFAVSRRQMERQVEAAAQRIQPPMAADGAASRGSRPAHPAAQRIVTEAERAIPADIPVTKLIVRGEPAHALLSQVRGGPWDVVVVGDRLVGCPLRARRGIPRLLRATPVPVLVVREAGSQGRARGIQESRRSGGRRWRFRRRAVASD